jgi:hypothetical protein
MRIFFILFLWMTSMIVGDVIAQGQYSNIKVVSHKIGDPLSPHDEPAPGSERFKMNCVATKDTTVFRMHLKEYVDGKKREEHPYFEGIFYEKYPQGRKISWEVVPDASEQDTLRIFIYFPGVTTHRWKIPETGKCFRYAPYHPTENAILTDEIPVMLFYEDDMATHETEKFIKKNLTDGKLNPAAAKNKALLSKIRRYAILIYTLK